jgi:putative two-component system response regulator
MTQLSTGLLAIFESHKDDFEQRVRTLEQAVAAILAGSLDEELRAAGERAAHRLAGSLGMFGLPRGSELAFELQERLAPQPRSVRTDDALLVGVVAGLRAELARPLSNERPERAETRTESVTPSDARVLVVDDDEPARRALAGILSGAGYEVRDVGSAREARHVLDHAAVDLLLSDVSMPGETGLDLIRFALSEHPETATLLISALEDPGIAQVAMDFGAYGYLSKPIRRSALLIGVMTALRRRDVEVGERTARETLERTVTTRTSALSQALERLEGAAEQSRVLQAETIHRWARASEYRDPGIVGHVRRVSRYSALLGRQFGLHPESLELASVLHDVGKIAVPDSILLKSAPLTIDERLVIQTHAEIGYGLLRDSCSSVLDLAASIARTHHEKFDGSGYPRGLSGANIPLEGRIVAVADVFDALTFDRVYRPAWSVETAIAWMMRERGRHFDPSVLDTFLSVMDAVVAIRAAPGQTVGEDPS